MDEESSVLEAAFNFINKGDYAEAQKMMEVRLAAAPGDIEAIHLLGTASAKSGDFSKAESLFKKEIGINPERPDAHYNLGLIHSQQNRLSEAKADFENTIRLNPNDAQALNDLGAICYSHGEKERGEKLLAAALAIKPTFKECFLNLFEILWNNNKYNEAVGYAYNFLSALAPERQTEDNDLKVIAPTQKSNAEIMPALTIKHKAPAIIKLSESQKNELFEKHIPLHLRAKKTGMNIAVIADFNIAGQLTQLFRLINENTIHRARCIIVQDDYLSYDKDLVLSQNNPDDLQAAHKIIESADFFHIGRFPVNIGDMELANYLRPDNSIIQYYGSELRANGQRIYNWHKSNRIVGLSAWDYTMLKDSPLFYHINMMYDPRHIKQAPRPEGTLKIVHPTTNRNIKKTELFLKTIERLQKQKCDIESILIEGKTNLECLELKSRAHLAYDQMSVGIYGVSAIESMAMGHIVFGGISNFAASYHPDNPIVWVSEDDLADKIKHYVEHRELIGPRSQAGIEWVKMHHDPMRIMRQHLYMYDFVRHGHRLLKDPDEQLLR
jgi:Tfp pilus assembly protein PilF